jgi:integrase
VGEVAGLRVSHLDFAARTLTITETVVRGRRGLIGFGEPKSAAGRRTLAVPVGLVEMLAKHMEARGLSASDGNALLFTAPSGGLLRYSNWVRRCWYPACVGAALGRMVEDEDSGRMRYEGIGFHDLRRANATGLVADGVDVKTAQAWLGHSESRLTLDLYAQAVTELGHAAAAAMGARFLPTLPQCEERAMKFGSPGSSEQAAREKDPVTRAFTESPRGESNS